MYWGCILPDKDNQKTLNQILKEIISRGTADGFLLNDYLEEVLGHEEAAPKGG